MPSHRGNEDEIGGCNVADFATDKAFTAPAKDHHRVNMLMAFQRRMTAGLHLEVAEFAFKLRLLKENLPCDGFERCAVLFLVGEEIDTIPTKARLGQPEALLIIHERTF